MKKTFIYPLSIVLLLFTVTGLKAQWGLSADSMVLLNNGSTFGGGYVPYKFCTDGNNGVITMWVNGTQVVVQRVDDNGHVKWGAAGIIIYDSTASPLEPAIAEDGHGGCYVIWTNYAVVNSMATSTFIGQRVDSNGNALWQHNGIPVVFPNATNDFSATGLTVLNNAGNGAYLALEVGWNGGLGSVRAAKIDVNGKPLWDSSGVAVSVIGDFRGPKIITDGFGGMEMMYWSDVNVVGNIKIQRLDTAGNLRWGSTGVALNTLYGITQMTYNLSTGANGATIATWDGYLYNQGIYAQKLDTGGHFLWGSTEVLVCDTPGEQTYPDVVSDGMGGAYFAWSDDRYTSQPVRIYAQRLNANGVEQWRHNGVVLDTLNTYNPNPSLAPDVNNGARVFWPSSQAGYHTLMQRLDTSGNVICTPWGTRVTPINTTTILYGNRSALHRNSGGDLVLGYANYGLYVQYVPAGCNFPSAYDACDSLKGKYGYNSLSAYAYQFMDSSTANGGTVQSRHWNFGDAASGTADTSSLANPQHIFSAAGNYNVCLVVTGGIVGSLCADTVCKQITINAPYNACDSLTGKYGYSAVSTYAYQFTDSSFANSGNVVGRLWNFGDIASGTSDTSTAQNPAHTFTSAGTYHVCLVVTGGITGFQCTDTVCGYIVVATSYNACDSLYANYGFSAVSTYAYRFTDSSFANSGNIFSRYWNFGDVASGTNDTSSLQSPAHTFSTAGTYSVCMQVTGGINGTLCTDTVCNQITVVAAGIISVNGVAIHIYPNPARDNFNVLYSGSTDGKTTLLMSDISGRTMQVLVLIEGANTMDVHSLAGGLYFLQVIDGNGHLLARSEIAVVK